jgi:hypothetical protein
MADIWKNFDFTKYSKLMHAMQSGVAHLQELDGGVESGETSPKNFRVALNSAQVETAALVQLLVDKGVFDPMEFEKMLFSMLETEIKKYERSIAAKRGDDAVKLNGF